MFSSVHHWPGTHVIALWFLTACSDFKLVNVTTVDVCLRSGIEIWDDRVSESLYIDHSAKPRVLLESAGGTWTGFLFLQRVSLLVCSPNKIIFVKHLTWYGCYFCFPHEDVNRRVFC